MRDSKLKRMIACTFLLTASNILGIQALAGDQPIKVPVKTVGLFHRTGWYTTAGNDADVMCEQENWRTKQWDESRWGGRLHARTQAHAREKEAWFLYIRGAGPAIHERSPGQPCCW